MKAWAGSQPIGLEAPGGKITSPIFCGIYALEDELNGSMEYLE
jgi:hypothetical protein